MTSVKGSHSSNKRLLDNLAHLGKNKRDSTRSNLNVHLHPRIGGSHHLRKASNLDRRRTSKPPNINLRHNILPTNHLRSNKNLIAPVTVRRRPALIHHQLPCRPQHPIHLYHHTRASRSINLTFVLLLTKRRLRQAVNTHAVRTITTQTQLQESLVELQHLARLRRQLMQLLVTGRRGHLVLRHQSVCVSGRRTQILVSKRQPPTKPVRG